MPNTTGPRILKLFVASPGDVTDERDALARLLRDINDVLAFLAPERQLTLELVRYETHAYPDLGAPQDVINRQIPIDYDIFVGIMWKRAGTPTKKAASAKQNSWPASSRPANPPAPQTPTARQPAESVHDRCPVDRDRPSVRGRSAFPGGPARAEAPQGCS
jgi:hypothetical protein